MITQFNDDEDSVLQGLRPATQVIYLRGIRRFMDYETGLVGVKRKISYTSLSECCEFIPDTRCNIKAERKTKEGVRAAIKELVRAGLVEKIVDKNQLIFKCILATTDESVLSMNNTRTTHEQPPMSNPSNPNELNGLSGDDSTYQKSVRPVMSNTHPITDIRKDQEIKKETCLSTKKTIIKFDDEAKVVAFYLCKKILTLNEKAKLNPNNWITDIEKAIRIDSRNEQELIEIIDWIYTDGEFWVSNILSGKTLRKQYEQMYMQKISGRKNNKSNNQKITRKPSQSFQEAQQDNYLEADYQRLPA